MSDMEKKPTPAQKSDEDIVDELFAKRESIDLTPENAHFFYSEGGLVSLELTVPGKEKEEFERVVVLRTYPISNPNEFLSVREPDSSGNGRGNEIGIIRNLADFPDEAVKVINHDLDKRYFIPVITKIYSAKDKHGLSYWDCDTSAGRTNFIVANPYSNIRILEDGRMLITDRDGNFFYINGTDSLDKHSQKKLEVYF